MRDSRIIGKLLQFDRGECEADDCFINGYVLDMTDDWTLIQFVDSGIFLDGYDVFRNDTVARYREFDDGNHMVHRALRKLGQTPVKPKGIDLSDLNTVVISVNASFPLVVIDRELRNRDESEIGTIAKVTEKTITLATIETDAEFGKLYRVNSGDITRVGFGGHYEAALWAVALWAVASKKTKNRLRHHSISVNKHL